MAIDNLHNNGSDENPLSGAYIRSLVKQLTTNCSKPNPQKNLLVNNNDTLLIVPNHHNYNPMTSTSTSTTTTTTTKKQAPNRQLDRTAQGHKKQVRRRLHMSRPYQERLLNMAEARKEIVTALKYHRASMKQANDRKRAQQQQNDQRLQLECRQQVLGRDSYESGRIKVKSEPQQLSVYNNYYPSDFDSSNKNHHNYNPNCFSSNISTTTPLKERSPIILYESLNNVPLPSQALGLNLNLQAFTNLDTNLCYSPNTTTTTTTSGNYPSSMTTSPLSSSSSITMTGVGPSSGVDTHTHPTLDEEEIAKMRSIGEQYQIEWDDTLNWVKSAWWFKFLKTVDFGKQSYNYNYNNDDDDNLPFGELMEFPPWLSPINDESFFQQHLHDSCSHDTTLPGMDIGDIDAMDDDWLS